MSSRGRRMSLALVVITCVLCTLSLSARADAPPAAPRRTWIAGGVAALAVTHLASVVAGVMIMGTQSGDCSGDCDVEDQENAGAVLLLPVVGPFIAIGYDPDGAALYAPLGVAQLASVAWIIGSTVRYRHLRREYRQTHGPSVSLGHGRELSLQVAIAQGSLTTGARLRF